MKEIPEVDAVLGTTSYDGIITALDKVFVGRNGMKEFKDIKCASGKQQEENDYHWRIF